MAATETWTPPPDLLFSLPETAGPVAFTISVEVEGVDPVTGEPAVVEVVGYRGSITPEQALLAIEGDADGLTVSADSLAGLFPIEHIDYRQDGQVVRVPSWEQLPAEAEELIEYRPSRAQTRAYRLDVVADLADGSEAYMSYLIEVHQDWSAGRDRLRSEIDARRNSTG
ncbi:hypothetical protein [Halomonas salipaludis]|uniref:Uncharacterized protein n=1 Tax=Halomonas salipaludis TaxID=2032625 RepID=A0A2A2F3P9_9GAMM|nr:hypothetical protein [Halomonas salipaludis]PAU79239.1 hypothetical protein CK498_02390 [Halomonas salipaludis]